MLWLKLQKFLIVITATLTLVVLFLGMTHFGTSGHMKTQMINCPFMPGHTSICKMSPMDHIAAWQSMFTTLPTKETLSLLFILLTFLALLRFKFRDKFFISVHLCRSFYTNRYWVSRLLIFNPLKEAFSRGILNPKLF